MLISGGSVSIYAQSQPPQPIHLEMPKPCPGTVPDRNASLTRDELKTRKQQEEQWLQLANAAYTDTPQRLSEAESFYNSVLQVDGKESRAYVGLANVYTSTQRYDLAIEKYQQAIKINPKSFAARYGLGNAYSALKQFDKAVEQYKKATDLKPNLVQAHYNLGTIYYLQKDKDGVLREARILMKLDEELAQKLMSLVNEEAKK
jgi:tetratricopeptide (TPR) repeat protein